MSTQYRKATSEDRLAIADLHAESWRHTYRGAYRDEFLDGPVFDDRRAVWEKRLSEPPANQFVVVAEEEGRIVGLACAYGGDDEQWGTLLDNIHVRPELHGNGIGTGLVAEVVNWCLRLRAVALGGGPEPPRPSLLRAARGDRSRRRTSPTKRRRG